MRRERGFTLIELLVVIIILGILLAVAIPRYFEGIEQAKVKAYCSTISNLKMALEVYRTTNSANGYDYPAPPTSPKTIKEWINEDWGANQFDKYFDSEPKDPFTGSPFLVSEGPAPSNASSEDMYKIYYSHTSGTGTYTLEFVDPINKNAYTTTCP